jgi:tetratricopeptide (TPR) repeat protein
MYSNSEGHPRSVSVNNSASSDAKVVSLAGRRGYRPDWAGMASARLRSAREKLRMDHDAFAAYLSEALGCPVQAWRLERWERGLGVPPAHVVMAAEHAAQDVPGSPVAAPLLPGPGPAGPDDASSQDGSEIVLPCRALDGRIIWVSIPRRTFLSGGLGTAALAAIAAAVGPSPLGARLPAAAAADMHPIETLRQLKRALIDADNLFGPGGVLPAVHSQIQVIRQLRADRRGADRQTLLTMQAQYAEFAGWLHQDARDFQAAGFWLDRALEWSHAAADREMATYVMARKSQLAGDMHDATSAIDLASAAGGMARKGSRLKATAATYGAHGYALAGQRTACLRTIDGAREMAGRLDSKAESPWATWLDYAYIDVQRGQCLSALGDHTKAATVFQQAIRDLPPAFRRDRGVYLAREALAHAGAREPEQAAGVGMQAVAIARDTHSGRVIDELARVGTGLAPWAALPAVADFQDALTSVLPTERTG